LRASDYKGFTFSSLLVSRNLLTKPVD
jgi:hypothetical protein